ncbi:deoxyuridine 5'-triphosphate nucleotidohydrolase [Aplysia californica]|uniref:Deoxyuridine 5'-triphosphate nucleotidohydrolase n=1 Tax=Aplysia californica TaxID=6500 RepID=A0ABM0JS92_APLCA|nr:deoxyuridine 5'-triphosphate nucleotidohydrolase [Aplysia californica]
MFLRCLLPLPPPLRDLSRLNVLWRKPSCWGVHVCDLRKAQYLHSFPSRRYSSSGNMPSEQITLQFAKMTNQATTPTRGSALAAGYDLYSAYEYKIPARGKQIVKTDIQIALPDGCYGRVAPRSGLAAKHFIDVGAGVIDQDYRGNVGVVMFNFSEEEFVVNKGDRIAQLICERIYLPQLEELPSLDSTERGSGGYGSTGKN